ncbi:MAG: biotin--[acetyl-CoA-carboxylase] ligase [Gammaproteobacteria bacterium]
MSLELLETTKICAAIEPENLSRLANLQLFDTLDSTNSYLLEQSKSGAPRGSVCFAEEQTKGRGRLNRAWFSSGGMNIACSMLWRFPDATPDVSGLSIAVGVMVSNVLRKYGVKSGIQLKWPNDVLVDNRKLAGILLERSELSSVVIGIGLNLDVAARDEKNWIDLAEITGQKASRNYIAGLLVNELLEKLPVFEARGLSVFMSDWEKHDALLDKPITVHTPTKQLIGVMRGINERGELLLENESGEMQSFCYGEVSVRAYAPED